MISAQIFRSIGLCRYGLIIVHDDDRTGHPFLDDSSELGDFEQRISSALQEDQSSFRRLYEG